MATITHTTFACDRCGANLGDKKPAENLMVRASKDGEWASEFVVKWDHFCARCAREVDAFFRSRPSQAPGGRDE